ncbi:transglycosylase domain-containing protein [Dictyobacter aurantiacus]|uniref:Penicillin-binding protein transpeptidase domain-containing protein n=1 Tax=Dictyobacter aurantiacus TaxID=1936993 RepID=A0A401ZMH8_9CHLR|nr:penicillin-binding transpeptidase domain-containing protein [Dictyobacter aurantiacus]GCE08065.1 hypothetical protein KDAU_53940 [Dictyobacter aurantiacus]
MKPDNNSKLTAANIEEKIQQVFQSRGQSGTSASLDETVLQDLYQTLYRGDEAIMERTWHRLAQRYPLIEQSDDTTQAASDVRTVITFPQPGTSRSQPTPKRPPQRSRTRTLSVLMLVAACLLIIGGSLILFTQYQKPTQPAAPPQKGPLQFFDRQGKLIYQIDSHNKVTVGNTPLTRDFMNYSLDKLATDLHVKRADLPAMGLKVTTTLDMQLQTQAYQKAQQTIAQTRQTHNIGDAAAVVLDYHDGSIRALFGNLNTQYSGYNVATLESRPLASAFKPITYLTAFERGISPGEVVDDAPQSFPSNDNGDPAYSPLDYGMSYQGLISYRQALQHNSNIPAVQLLTRTKLDPLLKQAQALGLHTPPPQHTGYSAALGTFGETVLNVTAAYGTIANQGISVTPHTIEQVTDSSGHVRYQASHLGRRIIKPGTAFMITDILSDQQARTEVYGKCSPIFLYSASREQCQIDQPGTIYPAAIETGESAIVHDTWTIGYTTDYVAGVWAGNDNYEPMKGTVIATDGAGQIWHDTMQLAEQGLPIKQFPGPPSDVVKKTATYHGVTTTDWYLK